MVTFADNVIIQEALKAKIKSILPTTYEGIVTGADAIEDESFSVTLRLPIATKNDVLEWFQAFQKSSCSTFRTLKTFPENTQKTVFKKVFHCLHNTHPKKVAKPHLKHTNCRSQVTLNVRPRMKRSKDVYFEEYPCQVDIRWCHNHLLDNAEAMRFKPQSAQLKEKFMEFFKKGHTPSSAYETHLLDLQNEHTPETFFQAMADGSLCPTKKWCYDTYYKLFGEKYGDATGDGMVESLRQAVETYNASTKDKCAVLSEDGGLSVVICSPLSKRVLSHMDVETLYVDSSGNMDRHNTRVFVINTSSAAGALPIGIFLTFSECEEAITKALHTFMDLVNADYKCEPKCIITDDCAALRNSLRSVFPNSTVLLCKFHVLQSVWRYVCDGKNSIHKNDRQFLYQKFQNLLNAKTEENFTELYHRLLENNTAKKYGHFIKYLQRYGDRRNEWCMFARSTLMLRSNHTNNYSEATFRVIKDKILKRMKVFSVVHLFDFMINAVPQYYELKLLTIVNNRVENYVKSKHYINSDAIDNMTLYVDSSGNMDRHNTRVFVINTSSAAGALPIGIFLTFSECEEAITKALHTFMDLVNADYKCEPKCIITDDCAALRNSLRSVFPNSTVLLCKFHVLQSVWRYVCDGKNSIHKNDRQFLYQKFQNLLNAKTEENFTELYHRLLENNTAKKYGHFIKYLQRYGDRRNEWCMFARSTLMLRSNHTNNYSEATFRVIKDKILKRMKAFSVVHLFDFMINAVPQYYELKLLTIVNNRVEVKILYQFQCN
ncbi:hypothetical protein M8J75_011439 [Diaphorina citri]|nr:hypothetical protein M8J75_011439 [Diaphorina citri]